MAGMAAKLVSQYFQTQNPEVKLNVLPDDENILTIGWNLKAGQIRIYFQFKDDEHVHIEGVDFINVPKDKYDHMYKVLNECNDKYINVKFVLNTESGQICVRDDAVIQLDSCGPECFELMLRMLQIVEDAYPMIMKEIWG